MFFHLYGFCVDGVSDQGAQFLSVFWRNFLASLHSGFLSYSNGQNKRKNQQMQVELYSMVSSHELSWSQGAWHLSNVPRGPSLHFLPGKGGLLPLHPGLDSLVSLYLGPVQNHSPAFGELLHVNRQLFIPRSPIYQLSQRVWLSTLDLLALPQEGGTQVYWLIWTSEAHQPSRVSAPDPSLHEGCHHSISSFFCGPLPRCCGLHLFIQRFFVW